MDSEGSTTGSKSQELSVLVGTEWEGHLEVEAKRLSLFRPLLWAVALLVVALAVRVLWLGDTGLIDKLLTYVKDITLVAIAAIGWGGGRGRPGTG